MKVGGQYHALDALPTEYPQCGSHCQSRSCEENNNLCHWWESICGLSAPKLVTIWPSYSEKYVQKPGVVKNGTLFIFVRDAVRCFFLWIHTNKSEFQFHCCFKWIQYQVIHYFQTVLIENPCYVIRNSVFACFSTKTFFTSNLLKPTGYVMHQQFSIQQLYVPPTLYLCVLYLSENKQRLVPLTA